MYVRQGRQLACVLSSLLISLMVVEVNLITMLYPWIHFTTGYDYRLRVKVPTLRFYA